jgi:hypothetical protein
MSWRKSSYHPRTAQLTRAARLAGEAFACEDQQATGHASTWTWSSVAWMAIAVAAAGGLALVALR